MEAKIILYPLVAMVVLTLMVAATMLRRRIGAMKARRIHPQKVATSMQMATLIEDTRASDNFRNLFETPVLFYLAIVVIYAARLGRVAYLNLARLYVASRCVHSFIHCGPNIVMQRFYAFGTGFAILLVMWGLIAYDLIIAGNG